MEWLNFLNKLSKENPGVLRTNAFKETMETFIKMIAVITPHIADELWNRMGHKRSIHLEEWPKAKGIYREEKANVIIEINGKVRDRIEVKKDADEDIVKKLVFTRKKISEAVSKGTVLKTIYVKNKLFNIVLKK